MTTHDAARNQPGGIAGRLTPEVLGSLGAISRVARALVASSSFPEMAQRGLSEMREVLDLDIVSLYLPDGSGRPLLGHYVTAADRGARSQPAAEIVFDAEAWRLAVSSGVPLIFREEGSWLVENPFEPPASQWLVLPLHAGGRLIGVVIAAAEEQLALGPTRAAMLTLIGDLLTAGISTAQLRVALEETEVERERARLAELVHDGLAQDLALAAREVALLQTSPEPAISVASLKRLCAAVTAAHTIVRERLRELSAPVSLGGLWDAVAEICDRFRDRGLTIRVRQVGAQTQVPACAHASVVRVLTEALANVEKHAEAQAVDVVLTVEDARLTVKIDDDGVGFVIDDATGVPDGHFGLLLMQERARRAGGSISLNSRPAGGTSVQLSLPI